MLSVKIASLVNCGRRHVQWLLKLTSVSRNRANAGDTSDNAETYFGKNIYYPFLDHCIAEFSQRFPDSAQSMLLGHKLMHGKVSDITNQEIESNQEFLWT